MKVFISWFDIYGIPPKWYGRAYSRVDWAQEVYYSLPINYIVRYGRWFYWGFLRLFYRIGLIDTEEAEIFRWDDFFRIKTH